jgi:hypothetical protein
LRAGEFITLHPCAPGARFPELEHAPFVCEEQRAAIGIEDFDAAVEHPGEDVSTVAAGVQEAGDFEEGLEQEVQLAALELHGTPP